MIVDVLNFFGTNSIIIGIASMAGIFGFILTIIVSIRTANISKVLKKNQISDSYNKERLAFQKVFEGHRKSIVEDDIRSNKLLKDILKNVEEYRAKYEGIMSLKEKITLTFFSQLLRKETEKVNYNKVSNYLALLSGRLSKKENIRNG